MFVCVCVCVGGGGLPGSSFFRPVLTVLSWLYTLAATVVKVVVGNYSSPLLEDINCVHVGMEINDKPECEARTVTIHIQGNENPYNFKKYSGVFSQDHCIQKQNVKINQ